MKRHHFKLVFCPATIMEFDCFYAEDTDLYSFEEKIVGRSVDGPYIQMDFSWSPSDSSHPLFGIAEHYGLDPTKLAGMCLALSNEMDDGEDTARPKVPMSDSPTKGIASEPNAIGDENSNDHDI